MKCIKCRERAEVDVRRQNAGFCRPHFLEYFEGLVARAIDVHAMFGKDDRVLLAVSGGKDSLVLWEVLLRLGYDTTGLHVDLGIEGYSPASREKTRAFAQARGARLVEVDLQETHGFTIPEAARRTHRPACSTCGIAKRWTFNKAALEGGHTVLATGHNLDDEAATLLGNVLHWDEEHLSRQGPVLEARDGLMRKVKPLVRLTERESASYAFLRGIDWILEECPMARRARSPLYKAALTLLEGKSAAVKHDFLYGFLARGKAHFPPEAGRAALRPCVRCGQPTALEHCAFCRLRDKLTAKDPIPGAP